MSGKPKGNGKRLTVPVLQGPSGNRRPQPREQQPAPRVQQPPPRKRPQQRMGPKTFDEYWNDEWQKIEQDKINNAPLQMRGFLQDRKARETAVDNEIAVLKRQHVAFMQGSNRIHLLSVLTGGGLLCSDFLRSLSRATFTKDAGNGTGDVCYFRFVMDTRPEGYLDRRIVARNIHNFASVGASGGIFYVLRADDMSGLSYRTASSTDSKGKGTETIRRVVDSGIWTTNSNNTEIGFSRAVDFARISEVYIKKETSGNPALGDPIYNNAAALLEELKKKGILLPAKWKRLSGIKKCSWWWIDLLGFFVEMAGFRKIGTAQVGQSKFDVFERTGEPDYVRGFQYIPRRKTYPYPLEIPQEIPLEDDSATATQYSPAERAEASEETLPAEHADVSEPAPPSEHADASEPTSSAEHAEVPSQTPPSEQAVTSKPAPRAKPAAAFGQTQKQSKSSAPPKIVRPKVGAGSRKMGSLR